MTESIKDFISYDPDTGYLTWLKSPCRRVKEGAVVSSIDAYGYFVVAFRGSRWKAHRLAWFLHYGEDPPETVDHINGDRKDNRLCNLRAASRGENLKNMSVSGKGSSKYKGVSWNKAVKQWTAYISVDNKKVHLGCFSSEEEAANAYNKRATVEYGEFARLNEIVEYSK